MDASWVRTPDRSLDPAPWATMGQFLVDRVGAKADVRAGLAAGRYVDARGLPWAFEDAYQPNVFVWFHRRRARETVVPFDLPVLYSDERIVVVDKPPFLATTPRGVHVEQTVVTRLRQRDGLADIAPAHRLDRLTAGVLLLTRERRWRGAYAGLFASGLASKQYEAVAGFAPQLTLPTTLTGRIEKARGRLQAELVDGEPNASTLVELIGRRGDQGHYRLRPSTGRTHQLRLQLCAAGIPIVGDPLYPVVREDAPADFADPLRLVARRLAFVDPIDGTPREFTSGVRLTWGDGVDVEG